MRIGPLTLAVCLVFAPLTARAQSAEVKKYFNAAISLYENLEYEKALSQLQKAKTKAAGADDESRIALLEGCVLADMGKEPAATAAFKSGFGMDVDAKLPVAVSPKVTAIAEKARASVKKVLAPTLEAERLAKEAADKEAAEKKAADEKKARDEALLAEEKKREEERQKLAKPPPAVTKVAQGPSLRSYSWIPGAIGLASGAAAVAFFAVAGGNYQAIVDRKPTTLADATAMANQGKLFQSLGYVFTGVGVAGVAAAVVMFLVGGEKAEPAPVALVPVNQGAVLVFTMPSFGGAR